jgi:anti-sigma regulatory factor (Ser/Thr protein kinase)
MAIEEADFDLDRDPTSVSEARRHARTALARWRAPVDIDLTVLLVSEVVTNAVVHGDPPVSLHLRWDETTLRVSVRDASVRRMPLLVETSPNADRGRGIALVDAVAGRWGVEVADDAKIVWFEVS